MKKKTLAITLFVLALAAVGCSKKSDSTGASASETTAAETTAAGESSAESGSAEASEQETEEAEQDSASGSITAVSGSIITIATADGSEMKFDLTSADINKVYDLTEGDKVYVEYNVEENTSNPLTATYVEVEEAALAAVMDPVFTGTVDKAESDSVTLTDSRGETYTFRTAHAYVVANDGIQTGKEARVTYIGDLEDDCLATKVVMEDSYESPDAEVNVFIGKVVGTDADRIVLSDDDEDYFTFLYDMDDPEEFPDDSMVLVYYDGVLSGKEIPASDVMAYTD